MKTFSSLVLLTAGLLASVTQAAPSQQLNKRCVSSASILYSWGESSETRYRVAYACDNTAISPSVASSVWTENNSIHNCGAINQNQQTYYNAVEKSWVIDFNEVEGAAGSNAANCVTNNFVSNWANKCCT